MIYLGIDPGQNTGIAIWNSLNKEFATLATTDFWGTLEHIDLLNEMASGEFIVIIEDPNLHKGMYWGKHSAKNINYASKIAQNVGMNKRDAQLIISYCDKNNIEWRGVKPTTKKWTSEKFKYITGCNKRCSQHARDAAKLVYGL